MKKFYSILIALVPLVIIGCVPAGQQQSADNNFGFHNKACAEKSKGDSPWYIGNLYDCQTKSLFIPYQLWTGMNWNGDKSGNCMHSAQSQFSVNGSSETTIEGPVKWTNPQTGQNYDVWKRIKTRGGKTQYFTCHEKGIGRVYDNRGPWFFETGRCKFPAGFGWKVGENRSCDHTKIKIDSITLDPENNLKYLQFSWWYFNQNGQRYVLDHVYKYERNYGNRNSWKQ